MKKHKRHSPSFFDRFLNKIGPSVMKICQFIDKQTHVLFEWVSWAITGGAYQPQPYKEPDNIKQDNNYFPYRQKQSASDALKTDLRAVMGDIHRAEKDITKTIKKMEYENPEVARVIQEAKNSPQFQAQEQKLREQMAKVQRRCQQVHLVCSYPTTTGSGNSSQCTRSR